MYQALYRKWRPRVFDDVAGQGHITGTLKRQVESGRLSHAYLFTGTRGTGKTTCAKLLARAVNCERPENGNPCNQCAACRGIEDGSILDVLELDAASNNRVDDIRAILDEAAYSPATVKKRVYIIDEVHMLSGQAFNALLQTLEEPPDHLMFILATTEVHKVPATIKSRCQQFSFKRLHSGDITARLLYVAEQEGIGLTAEGAALLARLADGGMRDALSLLDQCGSSGGTVDEKTVYAVLGLAGNLETAALLEDVAAGDAAGALERLDRLYAGGREITALAGELAGLVRDLLVRRTAPETGAALMTGGYDEQTLRRLAKRFDRPALARMLGLLQRTGAELARSSNRRTDMELCLMTLCDPTLDDSTAGLSARVARLERDTARLSHGERADSPAPAEPQETPISREMPDEAPAPETTEDGAFPDRPVEEPENFQEEGTDLPAADDEMGPAAPEEGPTLSEQTEAAPAEAATPAEKGDAPTQTARWPGWEAVRAQLKNVLDVSDYSFIANNAMTEGSYGGGVLTLWTANDFVRDLLDKPAITVPAAELLERMLGCPVKVAVRTGRAPAGGEPAGGEPAGGEPAGGEPAGGEPAGYDALERFLAEGQDNITVE